MNHTRFASILLIATALITSASAARSQTQQQLNANAATALKKADGELNDVYQRIVRLYASDTVFIRSLRTAEKAWIEFRDAQLAMKFPDRGDNLAEYGSVYPMCVSNYLADLTRARIKTLRIWLDGSKEGDICNGSVRSRN